jgi:hypothetical protein
MRHESNLGNAGYGPHAGEFLDDDHKTGIDLDTLPVGAVLEIETSHTTYVLENRGEGKVVLSGHPEFCPEPVLVKFHGSVGGPALIRSGHIEAGMQMAFQHPKFGTLRTSRVKSVREVKAATRQ